MAPVPGAVDNAAIVSLLSGLVFIHHKYKIKRQQVLGAKRGDYEKKSTALESPQRQVSSHKPQATVAGFFGTWNFGLWTYNFPAHYPNKNFTFESNLPIT